MSPRPPATGDTVVGVLVFVCMVVASALILAALAYGFGWYWHVLTDAYNAGWKAR